MIAIIHWLVYHFTKDTQFIVITIQYENIGLKDVP